MNQAVRYPFVLMDEAFGEASLLPYLPLELRSQNKSVSVSCLLDTGSTVNVMPYALGLQLGAAWEKQLTPVQLTGNLAHSEARALLVSAQIAHFPPLPLAFAWTLTNDVPLLLGQINFFLEFDVYFSRSQKFFEIQPKANP